MEIASFTRPAVIAVTATYPTLACAMFAWARASASAAGAPWPTSLLEALDARIEDPSDPAAGNHVLAAIAASLADKDGWTVPDASGLVDDVTDHYLRAASTAGVVWGTGESLVRIHWIPDHAWAVTISGPVGSAAASRAEAIGWPEEQVAILRDGVAG